MNLYHQVEPYYEPGKQLKACCNPKCEMSDFDWGFLCGLLKKFRPHNIVEVGVAEGGTSLLLDFCMQMLNIETYSICSVEKNKQYYFNKDKVSGYEYQKAVDKGVIRNDHHHFYLGKILPEVIEKITEEKGLIDFLILDTVHYAPGELFDFILAIPFLKENAVICLHDVALDYVAPMNKVAYICKLIFDTVSGKKFFNVLDSEPKELNGFPNIAAIQVTDDTRNQIMDLFSAFSYPWAYMPENQEIALYKNMYNKLYGTDCITLFDKCINLNRNKSIVWKQKFVSQYSLAQLKDEISKLKSFCNKGNLYLYGAGNRCRDYLFVFKLFHIPVGGVVVSDGHKKQEDLLENKVWEWFEFKMNYPEANVVVAAANKEIVTILEKSGLKYLVPHEMFSSMAYELRAFIEAMEE